MKFTKIAAVMLSCAMLLTGCGNSGKDNKNAEDSDNQKETTGQITDIDMTQTIMKVGDADVSAGLFSFYFNSFARQTDNVEEAKKTALEQCENNFLILAIAQKKGIEFDAEKQSEIDEYKQSVVDSYEGGYEEFLTESNLTDEDIDKVISISYYGEELQKEVDMSEPSDEEKREYFKDNYRRAKHILISTKDSATQSELSESEQAEKKKRAEELLERAKNGEDFDALISEFSEDPGSASNPDGYVFTDNEMVSEFQDGVDSLGMGEFTLVKSDYGYHIIQRLPLDETPEFFEQKYSEVADRIATLVQNSRFEEQVYAWKDEYGIEIETNDELVDEIVKEVTAE